ncbi:pseudouridine synthase [Mycena floridula]|nr:pseudouridine synthase [Mycena floridula]
MLHVFRCPKHVRTITTPSNGLRIYQDAKVLVLNKPHGIVSQGNPNDTSSDIGKLLQDNSLVSLGELLYPVHRLDKTTTGCLVLARSKSQARDLSHQFSSTGTISKTYLAIVRTDLKCLETTGEIRVPLQLDNGRACIGSAGDKLTATDWQVLASSTRFPLALVHLKLLTGFKHQLRVHMAHLKVPILGDHLHSPSPLPRSITQTISIPENRIFLHAATISFWRYRPSGPHKRFRVAVQAPLPADFVKVCLDAGIPVDEAYSEALSNLESSRAAPR